MCCGSSPPCPRRGRFGNLAGRSLPGGGLCVQISECCGCRRYAFLACLRTVTTPVSTSRVSPHNAHSGKGLETPDVTRRHAKSAYLRHPPPIEIGQRARSTLNFELETLNSWFLDFGF